jgi:hypothetical protein
MLQSTQTSRNVGRYDVSEKTIMARVHWIVEEDDVIITTSTITDGRTPEFAIVDANSYAILNVLILNNY